MTDEPLAPGTGLRADGLPDIAWCQDIPPGEYPLGDAIRGRTFTLTPQLFTLEKPFKLARYPITQAQFKAFMETRVPRETPDHVVPYTEPDHPRGGVWWSDTFRYARWLTQRYREAGLLADDWVIDVPSEIEWELTARYPGDRVWDLRQNAGVPNAAGVWEANPDTGMSVLARPVSREWCLLWNWHSRAGLAPKVDEMLQNRGSWVDLNSYMVLRWFGAILRMPLAPTWDPDIFFRVVCRPE